MTAIAYPVLVNLDSKSMQEGVSSFVGNKQAWLYALEKTMANTALAGTELFTVPGGNPDFGQNHEKAPGYTGNKSQPRLVSDGWNHVSTSSQTRASSSQAQTPGPLANTYSGSQKALPTGLMGSHSVTAVTNQKTVSASKAPYSAALMFDVNKYAKQNIVMLNSSVGAEVWIRDVHTARYKLMEMIKDIRHNMGELGAGLVKVVLNGKEVFRQETLKG